MHILATIDASNQTEITLEYLKDFSGDKITMVHILPQITHLDNDYSLSMNPNGRTNLLEKLSNLDAEKNKIDNERAKIILDHAFCILNKQYKTSCDTLTKRGIRVNVICDLAEDYDLIVLPKIEGNSLSHAIEPVIRKSSKPLLALHIDYQKFERAVFAFDGSNNNMKAIEFLEKTPIKTLKYIDIIMVNFDDGEHKTAAENAQKRLQDVGYETTLSRKEGKVCETIQDYAESNNADLIIAGAYGHSSLRHFFVGSTTDALLKQIDLSILLF